MMFYFANPACCNTRSILSTLALFSYDRIPKDPWEKGWQLRMASSPSKLVLPPMCVCEYKFSCDFLKTLDSTRPTALKTDRRERVRTR